MWDIRRMEEAANGGAAASVFDPLVPGSETKIYGVSWDHGATPTLTRTDNSVGMVAAAGVDANVVVNDFDAAQIYKNISEVTDSLGNVFIRIPKFYIEKTDNGVNSATWRISRTSFSANCYVPKCFGADGWAYIGKYNASLSGANKLESLPNKYPLINKNIVEFRGYAQANGAGYQQFDIHAVDLLQVLFYVEFATLNSQSIMAGLSSGAYSAAHTATATEASANRVVVANATATVFVVGQTISCGSSLGGNQIFTYRTITSITTVDASNKALNYDGAAVNIATGNIVYSMGWKSGFSASIAAKSGCPTHLTNGLYPCMYRGIENPWGNVWQFVDGVNINNNQAWVCPTPADYASNVFAAPYAQLGYVNKNADGYPIKMGFDPSYPYAQLPLEVGGSSTQYYSDYYYQDTGQRVALFGTSWSGGSDAGVSYWFLYFASSDAFISLAGRLMRKI